MVAAKQRQAKRRPKAQLRRDRELFRDVVGRAVLREYRVQIDGQDHTGNYLMVEVLNVPLLGPQLYVSPDSQPGDGLLEVVLVGEAERTALLELANGDKPSPNALPFRRGSNIRISAAEGVLHRDGSLWRHPEGLREFAISVQAQGVSYLR